ncbi:ZIP family metal transporter [Patescibacteria group bacterium]
MTNFIIAILLAFLISLFSLIGMVTLSIKDKILRKILLMLVGLSAGGLIGGAFFHLLPEALESELKPLTIFAITIGGFLLFFLLEKFLFWRHCHKGKCDVHTFTYLNLIGDSVHNFIDGLIIVAAFSVDIRLGLVTTLAIALHEIPQEIGDFGVLVYGGFSKVKALIYNFFAALMVVAGVIVGYLIGETIQLSVPFLLSFAAGGFIYIAATDLIPEIRLEKKLGKSLLSFGVFLLGVLLMFGFKLFFD